MAASKGEQAMNPQYEAHARLCKSIGDMAKENEDLKQHVTELENRLRALWDKLEGERKYYMEHLQLNEELVSEIELENERLKEQNKRQNEAIDSLREMYAKEGKR
jgi:predicted RNase H-like nuclease (RuvC/YqgF family)